MFILINKQISFEHVKSVGVFGNANTAPTLGSKWRTIIHSYSKIRGNRKKRGVGGEAGI